MQSGTEPPTMPGGSGTPSPMPFANRRRLLVQSARIRSWLGRPVGRIVLAVLVVMVVGGGSFYLVHSLQRHGLPDDIPLPNNTSFFRSDQTSVNDPSSGTFTRQKWGFTISRTAGTTLEQIDTFYHSQLPSNGWQHLVGGVDTVLSAEKGSNKLFIGAQFLPYNGVIILNHSDILLIIEMDTPTS